MAFDKYFSNLKGNNIVTYLGNVLFFLFIFIVLIDPTNTVLHKKDISFLILTIYCLLSQKPNIKMLIPIFTMFTAFCIPWVLEEARCTNYDTDEALALLKSMSPIIILLWVDKFNLIKLSRIPVVISCLIVDILFILMSAYPEIEAAAWAFTDSHGAPIMMSRRWFFGIEIFAVYLKSTPALIFVLIYYIYCLFDKELRSVRRILFLIIILFNFAVSGTRSTMLVPLFLFGIVVFFHYRKHKDFKYFIYPAIILCAFLFFAILVILASDTSEASNEVKYAHIPSYIALFENHPLDLIIGEGPGTSFYSEGFNQIVYKTEWSYLELIRSFGIFSLLIIAVFAYPLITLWRYRNNEFTYCIFWTYTAYLLIAGTNPLLLSSTGMIALLFVYSYSSQLKSRI